MDIVSIDDLAAHCERGGYEVRRHPAAGIVDYRPPGASAWWSTAPAERYHCVGGEIVLRSPPDGLSGERELPRLLADDWGRWHWLDDHKRWWWAQWE